VYHRTAAAGDRDFLQRLEAEAVAQSILTTVLSRSDAQYMSDHLMQGGTETRRPVVSALSYVISLLASPDMASVTPAACATGL
jgi:hypothetical protein